MAKGATIKAKKTTVNVDGGHLYYELRGSGPPLVFVSQGGGDAGEWEQAAELFAEDFTTVTYDRRGCSRSPKPEGWSPGPVSERSDDTAGLIEVLGVSPAFVIGCRGGATIVCDLIARHPEVLRSAIVYEPPLYEVLPNGAEYFAEGQRRAGEALTMGGPQAAVDSWGRHAAGDETWEALPQEFRDRVTGNADVHWAEVPHTLKFVPAAKEMVASGAPFAIAYNKGLLNSDPTIRFLYESCEWLSKQTAIEMDEIDGPNMLYWADPARAVAGLKPIIERLGG